MAVSMAVKWVVTANPVRCETIVAPGLRWSRGLCRRHGRRAGARMPADSMASGGREPPDSVTLRIRGLTPPARRPGEVFPRRLLRGVRANDFTAIAATQEAVGGHADGIGNKVDAAITVDELRSAGVRARGRPAIVHDVVDRLGGGDHALRLVMDPEELIAAHALGAPALVGEVGLLADQEGIAGAIGDVRDADLAIEPTHADVRPERFPAAAVIRERGPFRAAVFIIKMGSTHRLPAIVDDGIVLHLAGIAKGGAPGRRADKHLRLRRRGQQIGVRLADGHGSHHTRWYDGVRRPTVVARSHPGRKLAVLGDVQG